ncbi:MAG TPA: MarR family transcriptional regulator [Amnibacterium sp.]|jgi:DNA-binding MarR family transcriptional regulator|nr:MarR family transcriptional regulator [Amnibacterium sp.]
MSSISADRRHLELRAKRSLRALNNQISLLSHHVSSTAQIKDIDLDTLDYLSQHGAGTPSGLAQGIGVHPATMTGILDRLERGGWILRERDTTDRRAVLVEIDPRRNADLVGLYAGMDAAMNEVVAGFTDQELDVVIAFLERATAAGVGATERMSGRERP